MRDLITVTNKNTEEIRSFAAKALSKKEISPEQLTEIYRAVDIVNQTINQSITEKRKIVQVSKDVSVARRRRILNRNIEQAIK